jgi:hypothetical protein
MNLLLSILTLPCYPSGDGRALLSVRRRTSLAIRQETDKPCYPSGDGQALQKNVTTINIKSGGIIVANLLDMRKILRFTEVRFIILIFSFYLINF